MKTLKKNTVVGSVVLLLIVTTCRRKVSDFFPLIPGAVKIMEVTERQIIGVDTITRHEVRVTEVVHGQNQIPNLGKVWVVEAPLGNGRSTIYYYDRSGDTILKLVPDRTGNAERIVYLIQPLTVGQKWFDSNEKREETEVVACEPVTVPAGSFTQCFRLETKSNRVKYQQTLWLASGLGVVKRTKFQTWSRGDTNFELFRQEELVEYRILKNKKTRPARQTESIP